MSTAQCKMVWKLLFVVLVAVLPLTGFAQQIQNSAPVQQASVVLGISPEHVLIIGAGVLGGAVGISALLGGAAWSLAGGAAGALIGDWWYLQRLDQPGLRKGAGATWAVRS
jgi:hypothetical protein